MSGWSAVDVALGPVPAVPEIVIWQAADGADLWDRTGGAYRSDEPPPFWAFAWAGGQGLARYLLDHPETVRGRDVLDVGSGSGLVAIAAALAGAARVTAADIDPEAIGAAVRNARANGVTFEVTTRDLLDETVAPDVLLCGDVFYSEAVARRVMRFLRRAERQGAIVLVGDPGRAFLPRDRFDAVGGYDVPVRATVEGAVAKHATIWRLRPPGNRPG